MKQLRVFFVVFLLLSVCAGLAFSQAINATLLGTVTDASGAVVVNAKVTITETNTGVSRTANSNESGNYSFPNLPPGTYSVTVELQGFKKVTRNAVDVLVDTSVRVDVSLQPGQITETIDVTAEAALLQTDRADTGRKIEAAQLANLPMGYSRNFQSLINLVPGATRAFQPHSEFFNSQGSLTTQVNGVAREGNNVQFEGVDNNHRTGLLTVLIPPIEALQTVDVTTSNYEAELGRAGGAVTNIILKSGTNDLHGGLYWFHDNSHFNARETFQPTKPVTTYNYYGFNLGGPIKRNKAFLFGDYLAVRDRRGDGYIITVPGADFRNGQFQQQQDDRLRSGHGQPRHRRRTHAVRGQHHPLEPHQPDCREAALLCPAAESQFRSHQQLCRPDHAQQGHRLLRREGRLQPRRQNRFSARYSFQRPVVTDPGRFGIYGGGGKAFAATGVNRTQSTAINYTRLFSATMVMDARIGLSRYSNVATNLDYGTNAAQAVGIKGANLDPWTSGLTSMSVSGYADPLVGYSASLPWNRAETNFDYVANFTKIHSNHTFKWGADLRRGREELLQTQDAGGPRGEYQFRDNQTSTSGAAVLDQVNGLASFLVDVPNTFRRDLSVQFPTNRLWTLFTYFQDKWQVSPKLTVDLGLRHDFYVPGTPRLPGGWSNYDWTTNTFEVAGYGNVPMNLGRKTYYTNFAPRIGFAYRMNPKTVLRGGFGMSWIPFPTTNLPGTTTPSSRATPTRH